MSDVSYISDRVTTGQIATFNWDRKILFTRSILYSPSASILSLSLLCSSLLFTRTIKLNRFLQYPLLESFASVIILIIRATFLFSGGVKTNEGDAYDSCVESTLKSPSFVLCNGGRLRDTHSTPHSRQLTYARR